MGLKRGIVAILIGTLALIAGCSDSSGGNAGGDSAGDSARDSGKSSTGTDVSKDDLYAAGCPLLDGALGAGSIARKTVTKGLDGIRHNVDLTPEHDQWLKDAKDLLQKRDPGEAPDSVRSRVRSACADHHHPLSNLK